MYTLHQGSYTYRESAVHASVQTAFLTNLNTKNTQKTVTQFLCLIFKDIKDWLTHKKNHLKNNNIQICEFPACEKNFRIRLYRVRAYTM